jgi:hypothetical protein
MAKANNADSSDRRVGIGSSTVLRSVCRCAHVVLLCNITLIDLSWIAALTLLSMSQRFNMESNLSHVVSNTNAVNNASWLGPLSGRSPQYILI